MKRIIILSLAVAFILGGCMKAPEKITDIVDKEKIKDTVTDIVTKKLEESEQLKILKDYYSFIQDRMGEDKVLNFIADNIKGLDADKADDMLISLENYFSSKGYDMEKILKEVSPYLQYGSGELQSYFGIWDEEVNDQTTDGETSIIPVEEILKRALKVEKHIEKFPEGKTRQRMEDLYRSYMSMSIKGLGNQYIYSEEGDSTLSESVKEVYEEIINSNPDSWSGGILKEYLDEIKGDSFDLNGENAAFFYDHIDEIIDKIKRDKK